MHHTVSYLQRADENLFSIAIVIAYDACVLVEDYKISWGH